MLSVFFVQAQATRSIKLIPTGEESSLHAKQPRTLGCDKNGSISLDNSKLDVFPSWRYAIPSSFSHSSSMLIQQIWFVCSGIWHVCVRLFNCCPESQRLREVFHSRSRSAHLQPSDVILVHSIDTLRYFLLWSWLHGSALNNIFFPILRSCDPPLLSCWDLVSQLVLLLGTVKQWMHKWMPVLSGKVKGLLKVRKGKEKDVIVAKLFFQILYGLYLTKTGTATLKCKNRGKNNKRKSVFFQMKVFQQTGTKQIYEKDDEDKVWF